MEHIKLTQQISRLVLTLPLLAALALGVVPARVAHVGAGTIGAQTDIAGPAGSGAFGESVSVLSNGNIVVIDPTYSGSAADAGAVYLYDGGTGALLSTLTGSAAGDHVGSGGVVSLANGRYIVLSPAWDNGTAANAGAVTWCSSAGCSGLVSPANSLVALRWTIRSARAKL